MPIASRKGEYNSGRGYTHDEGIPFFNRQRALNFMAAAYSRNEEGEVEFKTELFLNQIILSKERSTGQVEQLYLTSSQTSSMQHSKETTLYVMKTVLSSVKQKRNKYTMVHSRQKKSKKW